MTLPGNRIFADVIKSTWGHIALGWTTIQRLVSLQEEGANTHTLGGGQGARGTATAEPQLQVR